MKTHVLGAREGLKVGRIVIPAIPVFVMNVLAVLKLAVVMFLPNKSMLQRVARLHSKSVFRHPYQPVALSVSLTTTFPCGVCRTTLNALHVMPMDKPCGISGKGATVGLGIYGDSRLAAATTFTYPGMYLIGLRDQAAEFIGLLFSCCRMAQMMARQKARERPAQSTRLRFDFTPASTFTCFHAAILTDAAHG